MDIDYFDGKTLREVYVILERLGMKEKIPAEMMDYLTEKQDLTHQFDFNEHAPLIDQLENENTKILLAYLVDKYIK